MGPSRVLDQPRRRRRRRRAFRTYTWGILHAGHDSRLAYTLDPGHLTPLPRRFASLISAV